MSELSKQLNCYILAGGKSSRMGEDKGLIELYGKAIIDYVIAQVKPLFNNIFIVSANEKYKVFGLELLPDIISDSGPAAGILTALHHSDTEQNFIVSCDMPFITSKAIEFLISEAKEYQILVPVHEQKFEPLCAVYSKSCANIWRQEMEKGIYKLQNIISNFKTMELEVEAHAFFQADFFTNINTKEELQLAIKKLNHDS